MSLVPTAHRLWTPKDSTSHPNAPANHPWRLQLEISCSPTIAVAGTATRATREPCRLLLTEVGSFPRTPRSGVGSFSLTPCSCGQGSFSLWHLFSTGFRAAPSAATVAGCPNVPLDWILLLSFFPVFLPSAQAKLPRLQVLPH